MNKLAREAETDSYQQSLGIFLAVGGALLVLIAGALWISREQKPAAEERAPEAAVKERPASAASPQNRPAHTVGSTGESNFDLPEVEIGKVYEFWLWEEEPSPFGTLKVVDVERRRIEMETREGHRFWVHSDELIIGDKNAGQVGSLSREGKRTLAGRVVTEARILHAAADQWAIEHNQTEDAEPTWEEISPYIKETSVLYQNEGRDKFGNEYRIGKVGDGVRVNPDSFAIVGDATDERFWGSYAPEGAFEEELTNEPGAQE